MQRPCLFLDRSFVQQTRDTAALDFCLPVEFPTTNTFPLRVHVTALSFDTLLQKSMPHLSQMLVHRHTSKILERRNGGLETVDFDVGLVDALLNPVGSEERKSATEEPTSCKNSATHKKALIFCLWSP